MSTNYYWKEIPTFFQYLMEKHPQEYLQNDSNIFKHIGHRAAAGLYCYTCGVLLRRGGTRYAHMEPRYELLKPNTDWRIIHEEEEKEPLIQCPCCLEVIPNEHIRQSCTFTVTMHRHIDLIKQLRHCPDKIIISEYEEELTALEFLDILEDAIIVFQDAREFS